MVRLLIGKITDYMTSYNYKPVKEVSKSCETGAATNIIFGLALGYKSVVVPIFALATTIFVSFYFANMYGVALAALGMLSTLSTSLTIDAYGPITDNAGGIAEMTGLSAAVRVKTDALDAAGNTTAAIGKGFAIGSAALVSLALFGAFVTRSHISGVDLLEPITFAGLVVGAMLPYWFSAMTMKSVGKAASSMVEEVRLQFREHPGIMANTEEPDYKRCVAISTKASLYEMIKPGVLVMLTPIIVGFFVGPEALTACSPVVWCPVCRWPSPPPTRVVPGITPRSTLRRATSVARDRAPTRPVSSATRSVILSRIPRVLPSTFS